MTEELPTHEEQAVALLAQQELSETVSRLLREGFAPAAVAAGLGATAAELVTKMAGEDKVPWWFYTQAKLMHDLIHGPA